MKEPLARSVGLHRLRVYVDTSVFCGVQDEEFAEASRLLLARAARGKYLLLVSTLALEEISKAPPAVRDVLLGLPRGTVETLRIDRDVGELAEAYLAAGVVGSASRVDATHVAAATIARADVIVSWNFRHIVNVERIRGFNAVNLVNG